MKKHIKILLTAILTLALTLSFAGCQPLVSGKSAYQIAVDNGFVGTEAEWLESLRGDRGANGLDGKDGENFNADYTLKQVYDELVLNSGYQGSFVADVGDVGTAEAGCLACQGVWIYRVVKLQGFQMHFKHSLTFVQVR